MRTTILNSYLMKFRRRLRVRDGWLLIQRSFWLPLVGMVGLLVMGRIVPIQGITNWVLLILIMWLCAVIAYSLFVPRSLTIISQQVDRELNSKERLSTAYEIEQNTFTLPDKSQNHQLPNIYSVQHQDALSFAQTIETNRDFPLLFDRGRILIASGIFVLVLILLFLPNTMDSVLAERAAIQEEAKAQAEKIEDLKHKIEQESTLTPELQEELIRQLNNLAQQLRENSGDRETALVDISKLENALRQNIDPNTNQRQVSLEAITTQLTSLAQKNNRLPPNIDDALDQIASDMIDMKEAELRELAEDLAQLAAQAAKSGDQSLAQALAKMSQEILKGNSELISQNASDIVDAISQAQEEINNQQIMQNALETLQESSQALAQTGPSSQKIAGQGSNQSNQRNNLGQANLPGQGTNGQGTSGGGTKADSLPPGTGNGQAERPDNIDTGAFVGDLGEQIFIPWERRSDASDEIRIPGEDNDEGQLITRENPNPSAGLPNPGLIPYQRVFTEYINNAQQAIERSDIPDIYRDLVHDYFIQLEP